MGTWGIGILQNDTTQDIWIEFQSFYNSGLSPKEIRKKLEAEYNPQKYDEQYADIWTGIAHGQWMCCALEDYTLGKVQKILDKNKGMSLWEDNEKDYKKRIKIISEFIEKIKTPRPKALKRKKIIPCPSYFKKGDVIAIEMDKTKYITALVVNHNTDEIDGENTIIFGAKIFNTIPTIKEHLKSEVSYLDIGGANNYYQGYFWGLFSARNMKKKIKIAKKIGRINFQDTLSLSTGLCIGNWNEITNLYKEQIDFLLTNKSKKPIQVYFDKVIKGEDSSLESLLYEHSNKLLRDHIKKRN